MKYWNRTRPLAATKNKVTPITSLYKHFFATMGNTPFEYTFNFQKWFTVIIPPSSPTPKSKVIKLSYQIYNMNLIKKCWVCRLIHLLVNNVLFINQYVSCFRSILFARTLINNRRLASVASLKYIFWELPERY